MSNDHKQRWFVVKSKPHQEIRAKKHLANQGFQSFLPCLNTTRKSGNRLLAIRQPLFPGYLFVRFDRSHFQWRSINSTLGVQYLISADSMPVPVPAGFVEGLLASIKPDGCVDLGAALAPGEAVKLIQGPFSGMLGRLGEIDASKRATVLLQIMGREVELTTQAHRLVPA